MEKQQTLPLRPLGSTGLQVTPICVGCAELGNMPETFAYSVEEEIALQTIREAFKSPINFMDTAAAYGDGESERRIGIVIREIGGLPPNYVLATKADRNLQTGDFSGEQIKRSIERSLNLLGLDKLQLVYLHDPEHSTFEYITSKGGAIDTLVAYKDQGVIEHIGIAGGPIDMMIRYVELDVFEAVITHNRYTLINRSAEPLIDLAHKKGLAVVNAAPYGSGILAKGPDAYPRYAYQEAPDKILNRVRVIDEVCKRYGVPIAAVALHFSLRDPRITSTIVGMSKPERIRQTIDLVNTHIPAGVWEELESLDYDTEDPEANRWK